MKSETRLFFKDFFYYLFEIDVTLFPSNTSGLCFKNERHVSLYFQIEEFLFTFVERLTSKVNCPIHLNETWKSHVNGDENVARGRYTK